MPEVTRADMIEAVRQAISDAEYDGHGRDHIDALSAVLRELEAGGWRPIDEEMVDAGAQALRLKMQGHKRLNPWCSVSNSAKAKWRILSSLVLRAALAPPGTSDGSDK